MVPQIPSRLRPQLIDPSATFKVMNEVMAERAAQDARFGQRDYPDGTIDSPEMRLRRDQARALYEALEQGGNATWRSILEEEIAEAFAEEDQSLLRNELIQIAAVAAKWAEAIDRRQANQKIPPP